MTDLKLTMSGLCFDRSGRRLLAIEPTGISIVEVASRRATQVACAGVRAVAGFDDQIWIASHELARVDPSGRPLGAPMPLPFARCATLVVAPCGTPAAVWTSTPALTIQDDAGALVAIESRAQVLIPITGRRGVTVTGSQLVLPSGLVVELGVGATVTSGAALADGKLMAITIACGTRRQLAVVSLTSAQITFRQPLATSDVRIASARGLAVIRVAPRALRTLDLRTGRELASVALDRDVIDHAVDPEGRWLALRDAAGGVELRELAARAVAAVSAKPAAPVIALRRFAVTARGRFTHGRFELPEHATDELTIRAPLTGEVLGVFPYCDGDVDAAVESATGAAPSWAKIGLEARLSVLARIEQPLLRRTRELAELMERELGRAGWECTRELAGLLPRMADLFAFARAELDDATHGEARIRQRAHGVVAVITPVMLPLGTSHLHVLSALIAGNAVVWKPSPLVATTAQIYTEILAAAGLPAGVLNVIHGGAEVGQRLVAHAGLDAVVFAGSREAAREIKRATADRIDLTVALHTGAKNLAIVTTGADVERAAAAIAEAAFLTGGQRSTAIGRVLVTRSLVEPMLAALTRHAHALAARPGFIAPMFSAERLARFTARLDAAAAAGARPVLRAEVTELRVGPSIHVLDDPSCATDLARDELFGPNLVVEPVDDVPAAIVRLRGHAASYASLFGGDLDDWQQVRDDVEAGAVLWNHTALVMSARLGFAAKGGAVRGSQGVLAMTRQVADCRASTGAALPHELTLMTAAEPALVAAGGGVA